MTKSQAKRKLAVSICKDVIAQINSGKLIPQRGIYVSPKITTVIQKKINKGETVSVRNAIKAAGKGCSACALGSMFITHVDKNNKCEVDKSSFTNDYGEFSCNFGWNRKSKMIPKLEEAFTESELIDIETAFEVGYGGSVFKEDIFFDNFEFSTGGIKKKTVVLSSDEFGGLYKTDKERLIAICENIIKNKGVFKPSVTIHSNISIEV